VNNLRGIFWLASYPKSGNTWFRIFLANVLKTSDKPIGLDYLNTGMIASAREWMDDVLGFDSALLSHDELDRLRPSVYDWYGHTIDTVGYHKIHDAYTYIGPQQPLIPTSGCLGALYFIRNPLDVAISLASHLSCTIDEAITNMNNTEFAFCKGSFRQNTQLRQKLLSWSMHVNSWLYAKNINQFVLRYEDMKSKPRETFTAAVKFLQLDVSSETIEQAITNAEFDKLQQQEAAIGFKEKPSNMVRFFRKGMVGDWQTTLTESQVARIIDDHAETMQYFGYLDERRQPIVAVSNP